jgi:hypothetical protein
VADVVLGHEDPAQVRVAVEDDAEHVVGLALVERGAREEVDDRRDGGLVDAHTHLDVQAVDALAAQQLVVDAQPRLLRVVVAAVEAGQEVVGLLGVLHQVADHVADGRRLDLERGLVAEKVGADDCVVTELVADLRGNQLETGCVRHSAPRFRTPGSARANPGPGRP